MVLVIFRLFLFFFKEEFDIKINIKKFFVKYMEFNSLFFNKLYLIIVGRFDVWLIC